MMKKQSRSVSGRKAEASAQLRSFGDLVQGQAEGGDTFPHEVLHLGQVDPVDGGADGIGGVLKFLVPRLALLQAFDVGADPVRRLDDLPFVGGFVVGDQGR